MGEGEQPSPLADMADLFTHRFVFEVDGSSIKGECEFNTDGVSTFGINDSSEQIDQRLVEYFQEFLALAEELDAKFKMPEGGGLKNMIIKKKEV